MRVVTGRTQAVSQPSARLERRLDRPWLLVSVLAAALFASSLLLPLWEMELEAPQYPDGLEITAYGTRMVGDIEEVNDLNHYIGAAPIDPDAVPELELFPYAIAVITVALLLGGVFARRGLPRVGLRVLAWLFPLGMLVDLQWWLYRFGHDLDRDAPLRGLVEGGFTPKVLGETTVVNFHSETGVEAGFWVMAVAAAMLTLAPWLWGFLRDSWNNTGAPSQPTKAGIAAVVVACMFGVALTHPEAVSAEDRPSIAALIAAAAPGATITVPPGTYHEQLTISKSVTLVGDGMPVIDGGGEGNVITVTADDVTLRGFVVQGSGREVGVEPSGIRLQGNRATVEGNRLRDVLYGIVLENSKGHRVAGNQVSSIAEYTAERRGHALYLWYTEDNVLLDNVVDTVKDGIFLGFASHNQIERNAVRHARYGIHYMYANDNTFIDNRFTDGVAGAALMFSRGITMRGNEFAYNRSAASGYGLLFKDVDDVEMIGNRVHHNRLGMMLEGAPLEPGAFVRIQGNLIAFNQTALLLSTTTAATFTENTFRGNLQQVEARGGSTEHRNTWSVGGRGNFWDDYQGYDAAGDGVGDLPFRYEGAYDVLLGRNEALRAYSFTFARSALELATKWFPAFRPDARVVDPHPLMQPSVAARPAADGGSLMAVTASALVVAATLGAMRMLGRIGGARWQPR